MNFSSRLKALRKSQKITQESLAKIIGVERSSVGKYEANNVIPSIDVLNRIADYFNVSVDYLLGRETNDIYASIGAMPVKKIKLPVLGNVACGEPIYANEDLEGYIYIDEDIGADFCLRAQGDSMVNARIFDGDILYIK